MQGMELDLREGGTGAGPGDILGWLTFFHLTTKILSRCMHTLQEDLVEECGLACCKQRKELRDPLPLRKYVQ